MYLNFGAKNTVGVGLICIDEPYQFGVSFLRHFEDEVSQASNFEGFNNKAVRQSLKNSSSKKWEVYIYLSEKYLLKVFSFSLEDKLSEKYDGETASSFSVPFGGDDERMKWLKNF